MHKKTPVYFVLSRSLLFLSVMARSNGLLNFGYLVYFELRDYWNNSKSLFGKKLIFLILNIIISFFIVLSPFLIYQYFIYLRFCTNYFVEDISIDQVLIDFSKKNGYRIAHLDPKPEWCNQRVPISYSSIQARYWNNGFLAYWELKQIPNFILAGPCVFLSMYSLSVYFKSFDHIKFSCYELFGILYKPNERDRMRNFRLNKRLFPFAVHLIILLMSVCFFMNVQVFFKFN